MDKQPFDFQAPGRGVPCSAGEFSLHSLSLLNQGLSEKGRGSRRSTQQGKNVWLG